MASGRKRAFDKDEALYAAMEVFWKKGYVGASLSDLTQNMGINKPSMYSAFGNKEALFIKATEFYIENKTKSHLTALFEPGIPFNSRLKNFLMSIVSAQCESDHPKGCYIVLCQSEVAGGDLPEEVTRLLNKAGEAAQKTLTDVFNNDPEARLQGLNNNSKSNALSLATVLKGTAAMARSGVPVSELEYVIDSSLRGIRVL